MPETQEDRRELLIQALSLMSRSSPGRRKFAQRAGMQYGNKRDIYGTAGYIGEGEEKFEDYWGLYERGDIAGRIVDMAPQTTWRKPPEVVEPEQEETEFMAAFQKLVKRLRLWHRLERADRLSRIGRYGVILIGTRGTDKELASEMPRMQGPDDVLYLSAYHEKDADIQSWDVDTGSERFGYPKMYNVDLSSGVEGFPTGSASVHHSRIIHVAEDLLADEVFGRPVLKRVLNRLFDLEKITAATGEAYWQLAAKILVASVDSEAEIDTDLLDKLGEDLEEVVHDLRRHFLGQGVSLDWLAATPPDPSGPSQLYMSLVAAASNYPKRILFGSETGERASSQDERQYHGTINERQERHAEPGILRALIDRLIKYGALPEPTTGEYDVLWPPLHEASDEEIAQTNKTRAETAKALTPPGGAPIDLVDIDDDGNVFLLSKELIEIEEPPAPPIPPLPEDGEAIEGLDEEEGEDEPPANDDE